MEDTIGLISLFDEILAKYDNLNEQVPRILDALGHVASNFQSYVKKAELEKAALMEQIKSTRSITKEEYNYLELQLQSAQKYLDEERNKVKRLVKENHQLIKQMNTVRDLLHDGKTKIHNDTKEKLEFLNKQPIGNEHLDTIIEQSSFDHVLSDLSYTFDGTLDESLSETSSQNRKSKRRLSVDRIDMPSQVREKKSKRNKRVSSRRSISMDRTDHLVATTCVTVPQNGPVSAVSTIQSLPSKMNEVGDLFSPTAPPISLDSDSDIGYTPEKVTTRAELHEKMTSSGSTRTPLKSCNAMDVRPHTWIQKAIIKGEICNSCCKRVKFANLALKCKQCKSVAHMICKDSVPLPCVPIATVTPSKGKQLGSISEYTPSNPPMIPPLVVHCIKEIEHRGMTEVGLYRVPGSDKEVKTLKEQLLKVRGVPNLAGVNDIHVICGCLKDFFRSLKEPLITHVRWFDFSRAADIKEPAERKARLYQIVSHLPQPNRDTLAYVALHLQRVASTPEIKMSVSNLSKMFGPTIIGYSKYDPENIMIETNQGNKVMAELINLPTEYWESFFSRGISASSGSDTENQPPNSDSEPKGEKLKTPSNSSLMNFFTPGQNSRRRKIKFFDTP